MITESPDSSRSIEQPPPMAARPLAFVLSGGGARAAYQAGVLSHIGQCRPNLPVPIITGVSAGAINAISLASRAGDLGGATATLRQKWLSLTTEQVFRADPASLGGIGLRWLYALLSGGTRLAPEPHGLLDTKPLRDFLERAIDTSEIAKNLARGHLDAVAISAACYATGQTITFIEGRPEIEMWERAQRRSVRSRLTIEHPMASTALPLMFPAIKIGAEYYGDGSVRHAAPLSPAVHLGADRILAISTRYPRTPEEASRTRERSRYPPPAEVVGLLFNSIFLDTFDDDVARLKRINDLLACIPEGTACPGDLRPVRLLLMRPSQDLGKLARDYQRHLPRPLRFLVGGLGGRRSESSDFLSYLLFESSYISRLIEIGEADAAREWPRISSFLESAEDADHVKRSDEASPSGVTDPPPLGRD